MWCAWIAASRLKRCWRRCGQPTRRCSTLVGTPKGRLTRLEQALLERPWHQARPEVKVKLLPQEDELYVFAESRDGVAKERSMRRRQMKWLWARLKKLSTMELTRDQLLMKLGAAKSKTPTAWRLADIAVDARAGTFTFRLDREKLRRAHRREGHYLLRTNLTEADPAKLWQFYLQLVEVEAAFKTLKRSRHPSRVPSGRAEHRDAYLPRLPRLLPACDTRSAIETLAPVLPCARCSRSSPPSR